MYPGVTLTDVDAGSSNATWSCIKSNCPSLAVCAADCNCSDLYMKALLATVADPSQAKPAFTAAAMAAQNAGQPVTMEGISFAICLQTYGPPGTCPAWGSGDGGTTTN